MSDTGEILRGRVLIEGEASGPALLLDDSLSFWGGFDPASGAVIDVHHPQYGERVGGCILFIPASRGSAGTPGGIAETLRNRSGPAAFVLGEADVNIGVGVLVANRLYGLQVPVIQVERQDFARVAAGARVSIDREGRLSVGAEGA